MEEKKDDTEKLVESGDDNVDGNRPDNDKSIPEEKTEEGGAESSTPEASPEEKKTKSPRSVDTISKETKAEDTKNFNAEKVFEGMVIVLGFLHCLLRVNPFAAVCLLFFLILKSKCAPRFILTALFTLLALVCPAACAEIALLLLDPPLKVCEDISDCFRNSAASLEEKTVKTFRKKKRKAVRKKTI